jgi:hypothetical protein
MVRLFGRCMTKELLSATSALQERVQRLEQDMQTCARAWIRISTHAFSYRKLSRP